MSGSVFLKMNKLTYVGLFTNICIHQTFDTPTAIARLAQKVNDNCGLLYRVEAAEKEIESIKSKYEKMKNALSNVF